MKISIIIQTFDRPEMLQRCYTSLHELLLKDAKQYSYEIIIADDGSTNPEVYRVIKQIPHTHLVINRNKRTKGPGYTLNLANKQVQGDYILQVEDDFILTEPLIDKHIDAAVQAMSEIPCLKLVRLRHMIGERCEKNHLRQYYDFTEKPHTFNGLEFRAYKRLRSGGISYQYTGNPHLRTRDLWSILGPYPESLPMVQLENRYTGIFNSKRELKTGRFFKGWFKHIGGDKSTRLLSQCFTGAKS